MAADKSPEVAPQAPHVASHLESMPVFLPDDRLLATIETLTAKLFPGSVQFAEDFDPAEPNTRYVVFTARSEGEWRDIRSSVVEWHRQVSALFPESINYFRLEVLPE